MRAHLIILEDDELLRLSVARTMSRINNLSIAQAGTLSEAVAAIDEQRPDIVVSDIHLPDSSGIELIGELQKRQLAVPMIFMTAHFMAYRSELSRHPYLDVLMKPVRMADLHDMVRKRLSQAQEIKKAAPFNVVDYLQLANMGKHSVVVDVVLTAKPVGRIVVNMGEVWTAEDRFGAGEKAFGRLVTLVGSQAICRTLKGHPGQRAIKASMEFLLLEAARRQDERQKELDDGDSVEAFELAPLMGGPQDQSERMVGPVKADDASCVLRPKHSAPDDGVPLPGAGPPPSAQAEKHSFPDMDFGDLLESALDAMLARDYRRTVWLFKQARPLRPEDGRVEANLARLKDLGYD